MGLFDYEDTHLPDLRASALVWLEAIQAEEPAVFRSETSGREKLFCLWEASGWWSVQPLLAMGRAHSHGDASLLHMAG